MKKIEEICLIVPEVISKFGKNINFEIEYFTDGLGGHPSIVLDIRSFSNHKIICSVVTHKFARGYYFSESIGFDCYNKEEFFSAKDLVVNRILAALSDYYK